MTPDPTTELRDLTRRLSIALEEPRPDWLYIVALGYLIVSWANLAELHKEIDETQMAAKEKLTRAFGPTAIPDTLDNIIIYATTEAMAEHLAGNGTTRPAPPLDEPPPTP